MQDLFYHPKIIFRFPNFDASHAWQMGHNTQQNFFVGKNCFWTENVDNLMEAL